MSAFHIFLLVVFFPAFAMSQTSPPTFSAAKKFLADLHTEIGHLETIYCGCPYVRTTVSGGDITREDCQLEVRQNDKRSDRVEWEHVVPASWFGQTRACWKLKEQAYPEKCEGKSGRQCCEAVNDWFHQAHNDPNNLFPSSGEVNGDRSNYSYGEVVGEKRLYGQCDFEIGVKTNGTRIAEPGDGPQRGVLARAMLYMSQVYGADVKMPLTTAWEWHKQYPPQPWEIKRAKLIVERTGLRNEWIFGRY